MIKLEDIFRAYHDCRKNKKNKISSINYEINYEQNLLDLQKSINNKTYKPSKSIVFVVKKPKIREVFAAEFSDRIVHHLVFNKLNGAMENILNNKTFNCRIGKGVMFGVESLRNDIIECSNNYTEDCYVAKMDLKGFFMSIDKQILITKIIEFIDNEYKEDDFDDLKWLCNIIIFNRPEKNCIIKSPITMWDMIDNNKSLFTNECGKGIPIGNLSSQFFANFLLNDFDWFLDKIGFKYHGRYVDDFYIVDRNKDNILKEIPNIRSFLEKNAGVELHKNKFYIQYYKKGIKFTGSYIKENRVYILNRTVNNIYTLINKINKRINDANYKKMISSLNSYLGLMGHYDSYAIKRKIIKKFNNKIYKYGFFCKRISKFKIYKKYNSFNIEKKFVLHNKIQSL